ncbi:hypothetical protein K5X82_01975 [Halosquirtibacter xylanolyticus]|uniref:hypothetical protein n=1 Tax=Halosquirtibacter xylanolyticus TaxID=3374599 RepID=UPI003748E464|nr:hypothetical protein K5X82_01975 [Prolixibacteraceae bacterium]
MDKLFIVTYRGAFGFIKPWTAVRDGETYSQQFLTPSMVEGIERKLFPNLLKESSGKLYKISGHRLAYEGISQQQEQVQTRGWNGKGSKKERSYLRPNSILVRGVLINPVLRLAFASREDAEDACCQHLCLARNEDVLLPEAEIIETTIELFNHDPMFNGYELVFEKNESSFMVGYHRGLNKTPMYGWLRMVGNPVMLASDGA